jgi:putative transposase
MRLIKSAHSVYQTQYHICIVTRFRREWINKGVAAYLKIKIQETKKFYPDWEYIEIGCDKDHIHIHMIIPPKYAVSHVVEVIKSNTARSLKTKFDFLKQIYWRGDGIWSVGFFVSTVGADEDVIRRYVAEQGKEDEGQAKLDW